MNKAILLCRLTKDIKVRAFSNGNMMALLSIAINNITKKDDKYIDEPCFLEAKVFGNNSVAYLRDNAQKGSQILLEGKIIQENWEDKQGNKKSKYCIICETIKVLDGVNKKQKADKAINVSNTKKTKEKIDNLCNNIAIDISDDEIPF